MTKYSIDFDSTLDAALEAARAANEPDLTMAEYLAIVLTPYLADYAKQYEPAVDVARSALKAAEESVSAKYASVTDAVTAERKAAAEAEKASALAEAEAQIDAKETP